MSLGIVNANGVLKNFKEGYIVNSANVGKKIKEIYYVGTGGVYKKIWPTTIEVFNLVGISDLYGAQDFSELERDSLRITVKDAANQKTLLSMINITDLDGVGNPFIDYTTTKRLTTIMLDSRNMNPGGSPGYVVSLALGASAPQGKLIARNVFDSSNISRKYMTVDLTACDIEQFIISSTLEVFLGVNDIQTTDGRTISLMGFLPGVQITEQN